MNHFSKQGWEVYNQMVASSWHHQTTKGGSKVDQSKIKPIARWLLRLMMWKTSEGDRFFHELEQRKQNGNNTNENGHDETSDDSDNDSD